MITTRTQLGHAYNHNGDFSGAVLLQVPVYEDPTARRQAEYDNKLTAEPPAVGFRTEVPVVNVTIPFADMLELVMNHLRSRKIQQLEGMLPEELAQLALNGAL